MKENQCLKKPRAKEKLIGRKVRCTTNTAKSEKATTISATQLSLLRPAIKLENGGEVTHCVIF
jgi:hypothetical protein